MKMNYENEPLPSVIEMLMGLNTQPVRKTQRERVMSDNYVQKTSALRISCKSLPRRRCSSTTAMQVDVTDLEPTMRCVDQVCNTDYGICRSDTMFRSILRDFQDSSLNPCHPRENKSQNCPEFENKLGRKLRHDAMKSQQMRKHIPFKPSKGRFSVKKCKGPDQDFMSENVTDKFDPSISFLSGNRIRKEENLRSSVPSKGNWIMTHRSLIRPRTHWDTNWHLVSEEASRSAPDTRLHITACTDSSIPCNSEPLSTNLEASPSVISENESLKVCPSNKYIRGCNQNVSDGSNCVYGSSYEPSSCLGFSRLKDCEMGLANQTLATQNDHTYGSGGRTQIGLLNCDDDDIFQEASQSLSDLASCPTPEPLSPTSSESEEVSRCSPISVLESISKGGVPSTMDCFMNGSTDLYEVYSEGLGMTVSSDEDNQEDSIDVIEDNTELSDRSYLVHVLGEAYGFGYMNYNEWNSFENPINPLVFQILEEKYGTNLSWPRSDRKLLFDRINLELSDTAKSCFSIRQIPTSLRQKFIFCLTREEVEENLWRLVLTEAPKTNDIGPFKNKNSPVKKGKKSNALTCKGIKISEGDFSFLELEDYMDEIIIDIERSLLDDLVFECS